MSKRGWVVLVVGVILLLAAFIAFFPSISLSIKEKRIKKEITDAGYCNIDSDCVLLQSKCPFDCYAPVNKNESGRIKELIESFDSRCAYGCVVVKGTSCIQNKCSINR